MFGSLRPHGLYSSWNSPGWNTGVGSFSLLQGSSQHRDWSQVSCITGRFFTCWTTWEVRQKKINIIWYCLYVEFFLNGTNGSVQFSCLVVSNSLWPHGLQHTRLPCPSPTPRAYSNSCPSHQWCHPTISSSIFPFSSCLQSFSASGFFSKESILCIRWPKYWSFSFSISPSSELISFKIDWLDLQGTDGLIYKTEIIESQK